MSLDPMAGLLAARPEEPAGVKIAALEVLAGTGGLTTPKSIQFVLDLLDASDSETRLAAVQTVEEARLTKAVDKLVKILADPKREAGERSAVLKATTRIGLLYWPLSRSLMTVSRSVAASSASRHRRLAGRWNRCA